MLAAHFTQVGLKLQGPMPIAYLNWTLHVYFCSLNILETVEMWLDGQQVVHKLKPPVAPPCPGKL